MAAPAIDQGILAQQYGFTLSVMNSNPELAGLFNQAVSQQWTPDRFKAAVQNTNWYKSMADTQRKALLLQATDPATYGKLWGDTNEHVRNLASTMGVSPDDWGTILKVSGGIIMNGWSDERARNELGLHLNFGNSGLIGGAAGQAMDSLNAYAYSMGVKNADSWSRQKVMDIVRGVGNEQSAKNEILEQSIAMFPQYEKQLRAGMTAESLAQPYTQSMQQILEVPAGSVNLFDPTIKAAMSYRDPTGTGAAQPLWQFQNSLRQDPRWSKTQNAQDAAMGTAHKVLADFGIYS